MPLSPMAMRLLMQGYSSFKAAGDQARIADESQAEASAMDTVGSEVKRNPDGTLDFKMKGVPQRALAGLFGQGSGGVVQTPQPAWSQENLETYRQAADAQPQAPTGAAEGGGFMGMLKNIGKSLGAGGGPFAQWDRRRGIGNLLGMMNTAAVGQAMREQDYTNAMSNWRREMRGIQDSIKRNEIDFAQAEQALQINNLKYREALEDITYQNTVQPAEKMFATEGDGPTATQANVDRFKSLGLVKEKDGKLWISPKNYVRAKAMLDAEYSDEVQGFKRQQMRDAMNAQDRTKRLQELEMQKAQMKQGDKNLPAIQQEIDTLNKQIEIEANSDVEFKKRVMLEGMEFENAKALKAMEERKQMNVAEFQHELKENGGVLPREKALVRLRQVLKDYMAEVNAGQAYENSDENAKRLAQISGRPLRPMNEQALESYRILAQQYLPSLPVAQQEQFATQMGLKIVKPNPAAIGSKSLSDSQKIARLKKEIPGHDDKWYLDQINTNKKAE